MVRRFPILFLVTMLLAGCPSGGTPSDASDVSNHDASDAFADTGPDDVGDAIDDTTDAGPTGSHEPLPIVPDMGGPRLAHPEVFVLSYADDPDRTALESYGQWIVGSSWLTTVGADYGVQSGTYAGSVELASNAPDAITAVQIETMLANGLGDGTIAHPASGAYSNALYVIAFPAHTTVTVAMGGATATACRDFGGFHGMLHRPRLDVAYAVVPTCSGFFMGLTTLEGRQETFSHELIEAATDADPLGTPAFSLRDGSAWFVVGGAEVADLCELQSDIDRESGNVAALVWSNSVAMLGNGNPCLPTDPTLPYFNTSASPSDPQFVSPGDSVTLELHGWSTMPTSPWRLSTRAVGDFMPTMQLSATSMIDGGTATLQITVPASTPNFRQTIVYLYSQIGTRYVIWPIVVRT